MRVVKYFILGLLGASSSFAVPFQDDNSVNVPKWSSGQVKEPELGTKVIYLGDTKNWSIWKVSKGEANTCYALKAAKASKPIDPWLIHIGGAVNSKTLGPGVKLTSWIVQGELNSQLKFYGHHGNDSYKWREMPNGKVSSSLYNVDLQRLEGDYEFEVNSCEYPSIFVGCKSERAKINFNYVPQINSILQNCTLGID